MYRPVIYDPISVVLLYQLQREYNGATFNGRKEDLSAELWDVYNWVKSFSILKDKGWVFGVGGAWMDFVDRSGMRIMTSVGHKRNCILAVSALLKSENLWVRLALVQSKSSNRTMLLLLGWLTLLSWEKECGGDTSGCILHPDFWWVMYSSTATNTIRIQFGLY